MSDQPVRPERPAVPGEEPEPDDHAYRQLAIGMSIGLLLGVLAGVSIGDMVLTLPAGAVLGVLLGLALGNLDDGHGSSRHGRNLR